jgi:hypothetical protein
MAVARGDDAEVDTNRKCSILLAVVLALAAVTLVPAITVARESAPTAAPKALRMMPPVISVADCGGTLARARDGSPEFDRYLTEPIY